MTRAFLYACSTAADLGRTVLDEKLPELRRFAALRNWEVVGEFTDSIPTGVGKRPGFAELCEAMRAGKADVVLANSIADLCWDLRSGLARLRELGLGTGVALVCVRNSFDATTSTGAIRLLDAMALVSEHGRDRAHDRQRIGILRQQARDEGVSMAGRPRVVLSLMEIKDLWEKQGLSQPEVLQRLTAVGAPVSKGTLSKAILNGVEAGELDPAARAQVIAKRGGLRRGGNAFPPVAVDGNEVGRLWEQGETKVGIAKKVSVAGKSVSRHRVDFILRQLAAAGMVDEARHEEALATRRRRRAA
ncbi:MAG: recombinase family protein [Thermoanaerobaculia bacterium]